MANHLDSIWTPELEVRLAELWAEGLSTKDIGTKLGVNKNAVIGKAHRLKLPSRPKPRGLVNRTYDKPVPPPRSGYCCWPPDMPEGIESGPCDAVAVDGKPYCAHHMARAYVKPRPRGSAYAARTR